MQGFYIEISNGLLRGHRKRMGTAVWEFMWLLDKMTKIDGEVGFVLGGKPIKLKEIAEDLETNEVNISKNLNKLKLQGYIQIIRTGRGLIIKVIKAKKRFNQKIKSDLMISLNQTFQNISSNKTRQYRQDSKTITKVIKEFGNPLINEISKYFLEVMKLPLEDCTQRQSRQYWNLLLKESKTGIEGVKWLINLASNDEFYKSNITSSKDLYYKRVKIISRKRGEHGKSRVSIDVTKI
jgi:DNA-binding MarR family transcriptional regulator